MPHAEVNLMILYIFYILQVYLELYTLTRLKRDDLGLYFSLKFNSICAASLDEHFDVFCDV